MKANALVIAAALLLAACGSQQAGYQISDRNHSISVTRDQSYPGSAWTTWLVVSRFPECQRRYALAPSGDKFKLDLYRVEPGVFILNQGKSWYVAETQGCQQQKYAERPPEPGDLIGSFVAGDEGLRFVDKGSKAVADGGKP